MQELKEKAKFIVKNHKYELLIIVAIIALYGAVLVHNANATEPPAHSETNTATTQFFCIECWDDRCDGTWCIPHTPPPPCWRCGVGGCGAIFCCDICGEFQCQGDCTGNNGDTGLKEYIARLYQAQIEYNHWSLALKGLSIGLLAVLVIAVTWGRG